MPSRDFYPLVSLVVGDKYSFIHKMVKKFLLPNGFCNSLKIEQNLTFFFSRLARFQNGAKAVPRRLPLVV